MRSAVVFIIVASVLCVACAHQQEERDGAVAMEAVMKSAVAGARVGSELGSHEWNGAHAYAQFDEPRLVVVRHGTVTILFTVYKDVVRCEAVLVGERIFLLAEEGPNHVILVARDGMVPHTVICDLLGTMFSCRFE